MKKIAVILVHFGELSTTKVCITSLLKKEKYPLSIIIVNNTQELLRPTDFQSRKVTVINNKVNKGFAAAVNIGIKHALAKHVEAVLLLNNDTVIVKPFVSRLIALLFSRPDIGIVGPAIRFIKDKQTIYDLGGYVRWFGKTYHDEVGFISPQNPHAVTYMTGAAMLIKKEVFQKIGMFDTKYFLYYEDVDFCLKAKKKGFFTFINPEVFITHQLSKTVGRMSSFAVYHQTKSALIFGKKNFSFVRRIFQRIFIIQQTMIFILKNFFNGLAGIRAIGEYYL